MIRINQKGTSGHLCLGGRRGSQGDAGSPLLSPRTAAGSDDPEAVGRVVVEGIQITGERSPAKVSLELLNQRQNLCAAFWRSIRPGVANVMPSPRTAVGTSSMQEQNQRLAGRIGQRAGDPGQGDLLATFKKPTERDLGHQAEAEDRRLRH